VDYFHKKLGKIMWNSCGLARNEADLKKGLEEVAELRAQFWKEVKVPGKADSKNSELEKAGRVADFFELGELMIKDALDRDESCGCHLRIEHVTEDGEAKRNDEKFKYVSAYEYLDGKAPKDEELHKEHLEFEAIELKTRNYKES